MLLLWGEPGDVIVESRHLKQPAAEFGPVNLIHDHERGTVALHDPADPAKLLAAAPGGLSASDAAAALFGNATPNRNQVEKARRKLERFCEEGHARRIEPVETGDPVRYVERWEREVA